MRHKNCLFNKKFFFECPKTQNFYLKSVFHTCSVKITSLTSSFYFTQPQQPENWMIIKFHCIYVLQFRYNNCKFFIIYMLQQLGTIFYSCRWFTRYWVKKNNNKKSRWHIYSCQNLIVELSKDIINRGIKQMTGFTWHKNKSFNWHFNPASDGCLDVFCASA